MPTPTNTPPLKSRVLRAGGWVLGSNFVAALIRLGGNLLMTRLLVPEVFGLMAIVNVLMAGFAFYSDMGLGPNIVSSKRGEDPDFLNTVWIVQILRGALMWLMAILLGVVLHVLASNHWLPADSVYAHPLLPMVIAAYASTSFISGFQTTKVLLARRRFELARMTQIDITSQIIGLIITFTWALLDPSVWAFVGGAIITTLLKMPFYHAWLPGPSNRWHWDTKAFKEIVGFGKWVFLSSILTFLVNNGDRLLLGGMINAHQMGFYSIAYLFVSFAQIAIGKLSISVAFPAMAEMARNDPSRLREAYYKFRLPFDVVMLFASGLLFTFGTTFVRLLYDSRYVEAGPIMEILAVGLIAMRYQLTDQCYLAMGKPRLLSLVSTLRFCVIYALVPMGFWLYQFNGALWAIALAPFASLPLIFYLKIKHHIIDIRKELLVLPVVLVGAGSGWVLSQAIDLVRPFLN